MATNINTSFETEWSLEVHLLFQQEGSRLRPTIRNENGVTGDTFNFETLGTVVANTKARHAEVTPLNIQHGRAAATIADAYAPIYLDSLDAVKVSPDHRRTYVRSSVNAIGRKVDTDIGVAMDTTTVATTTTAGGFTFAKFLEAHEELNSSDVPMEMRYAAVGAKQMSEALAIENLTSADYNALLGVYTGQISQALGMSWVLSTRLPLDTNVRSCFFYHADSVGIAMNQDVTTEVNYIPQRVSWLINTFLPFGVALIDETGCVKMECSEA